MMKETAETRLANRTAHAMRAAAIRLARQRAGQDTDPAQAYGCVDWFRYDVPSPPREKHAAPPLTASRDGIGRGGAPAAH